MENKIEFNWEKYQSGEYDCVIRDGIKVEQLHKFNMDCSCSIYGVIKGESYVRNWYNNGNHWDDNDMHSSDLFLIPKEKEAPSGLYTMTENGLVKGCADSNNGFDISQLTNVSIGTGVNTIPKEKEDHSPDVGKMVIPELKGVLMEVSDDEDFIYTSQELIIGTLNGLFISNTLESWGYARPIKEVKECWVNVFYDGYMIISPTYSSKEEALEYKNEDNGYIKTIRITNKKDGE